MHDLKNIRTQPDLYKKALQARGQDPVVIDRLLEMDRERRTLETEQQERRSLANTVNRYYGLCKQVERAEEEIEELERQLFEMVG